MPAKQNIDRIAGEFEAGWIAGDKPNLAEFVARIDEDQRTELLATLIPIDVAYGRQVDEQREAEYYTLFGEEAVAHARRELMGLAKATASNPRPTEMGRTAPVAGDRLRYFGEYKLLEEIARGGMGVVYKAQQVKLNRIVALKMILSGEFAGNEEVKRFQTEAEAAANLDHPGIVPIFEIGEYNGQHYFSMGFVDGPSLQGKLRDGPLAPQEAARLCRRIAVAVAYAHGKGVVHRDLKPANVLIDTQGEPKVTDFGLAKKVEGGSDLTRTGAVMGTPSYMPPEQALGLTDQIGPAADVYSLGAILYCLLTGKPPFQAATMVETLRQVIEREPVSPRLLNPDVNIDLETICLKCLEKDIGLRMESAEELAAELNRYLLGEPIRSRRLGPAMRVGRWMKRNRTTVAVLALSLFSTLVIIAAIGVARQSSASRELTQWSNAFEAGIERLQLTPEHLGELEALVAKIGGRDSQEGNAFRQRLLDAWSAETERAIRRPYLQASAVTQIESALTALEQRGSDQAPRLQKLLDLRHAQWQIAFRLQAPFADLATVFAPGVVKIRDAKLYANPSSDVIAEESTAVTGGPKPVPTATCELSTQVANGPRTKLQAVFDADWEQGQEIGLSLNHGEKSGYEFLLRPAADLPVDLEIPLILHEEGKPEPVTFAEARRLGGRLLIEIRRNGSPIQKHEQSLDAIAPGPLRLWVTRDRGELSLQVNAKQLLSIRDPFPITASRGGVFAVRLPEQTGLITLQAEEMLSGVAITTLEQADELFEQAEYNEAMSLYNKQLLEAQDSEVQQEARLKYGLCLSHLNRVDEAIEVLHPLLAEPGERWPPQAGVQLWLMLVRQNRSTDADAVYELLSARFSFEQLALIVPADVREEILDAYTGTLATIGNAVTFRPDQIRRLERAVAVERLLSNDGRGKLRTQVELSRGYRFLDDYASSLAVLEPMVRTTYHPTVWRNYLRTLRFLNRTDEALRECNHLLDATHSVEHPNTQALQDRIYIHAARADWEAAEGDVLELLSYQERSSPVIDESLAYCTMFGGFLRADRGDEPGAMEYWRRGYQHGRPLLAKTVGADSGALYVLIMGALCGELSDEEGLRFFQSVSGGSESPLAALATQLINPSTIGKSLRGMWTTSRGRNAARGFAFDKLTLRQRIEEPIKLLGTQYVAEMAFSGRLNAEQEQIIWRAMTVSLDQGIKEHRLNTTQLMQLGLAWKGTSNYLGWQGVAPTLDAALRGPLAYLMAHRYLRLNDLPEAEQMLQTVIRDAGDDLEFAQLAKDELELLQKGQATLRLLRHLPSTERAKPIEIVLQRDGKQTQRLVLDDQVDIALAAGSYELSLAQADANLALSATKLTLAAADRAVIEVESRWHHGPEIGRLPGLLPRPADLPERGRWQLFGELPLGVLHHLSRSPSGNYLAVSGGGDQDGVVRIYDTALKLTSAFPVTPRSVFGLSWRHDGHLLAIAGGQPAIDVWQPTAAQRIARLPTGADMSSVAWSPDGSRIAGGAWSGTLFVWDAAGRLLEKKSQELGDVFEVAWSQDGESIVFVAGNGTLGYWSLAEDTITPLAEEDAGRWSNLCFSPDGHYLAATHAQNIVIWDWAARHRMRTYSPPVKSTSSTVWASDSKAIWVRADERLLKFELGSAADAPAVSQKIQANNGLTYDSKTELFAAYRWPNRLMRFDKLGATTQEVAGFHSWGIHAADFHPDGQGFAVTGDRKNIKIFDSRGSFVRQIDLSSQSRCLAYNSDGTILVSACDDGQMRLLSPRSGEQIREWKAHGSAVRGVVFHPQNETIASCGEDKKVQLWSLTGELQAVLPTEPAHERALNILCFSPDGTRLAAAGDAGDVLLWDQQGKLVHAFQLEHAIKTASWSQDGSRLALGAGSQVVLCSRDGQSQTTIGSPRGTIIGCDWSDAGEVVVVDANGGARRLDLSGAVIADWQLGVPALRTVALDRQRQQLLAAQPYAMLHGWNLDSRLPTFTTVSVDNKTFTFDGHGRLRNEGLDDIAPLMYMTETTEGFQILNQKEFDSSVSKAVDAVSRP